MSHQTASYSPVFIKNTKEHNLCSSYNYLATKAWERSRQLEYPRAKGRKLPNRCLEPRQHLTTFQTIRMTVKNYLTELDLWLNMWLVHLINPFNYMCTPYHNRSWLLWAWHTHRVQEIISLIWVQVASPFAQFQPSLICSLLPQQKHLITCSLNL